MYICNLEHILSTLVVGSSIGSFIFAKEDMQGAY